MATIIRDDRQFTALSEIESALSDIRLINQILLSQGTNSSYHLGMAPERGKPVRFDIGTQELKPFFSLCMKRRTRLIRRVQTKASRYRIELSPGKRFRALPLHSTSRNIS